MPHDQAYLQAEKKIEEARRLGSIHLYLNDMDLTELPETIGQLSKLEYLDISNNQLTSLPETLENLTHLVELDLHGNNFKELPKCVCRLSGLKKLNLMLNNLISLPAEIGQLAQLEKLVLGYIAGGNPISELPNSIGDLSNLTQLHAMNCQLTSLPSSIAKLEYLRDLELYNNPLDPFNPDLSKAYQQGLDAIKAYLRKQNERKLKVFLCYATQDRPIVHEIYQKFITEGWIEPWLDAKKLLPGQDWQVEIKNAVETADNVLIFLSNTSINKDGFIQKELRLAKDIALEKAEGSIFLIPLRLDDCEVPKSLQLYQWANYFGTEKEETYSKMLESLRLRLIEKRRKEAYTKQGTQHD